MVFGQFVYVLQGPPRPTARRHLRVRKIGDFDADFCELQLQAHTLFGPLPVVSLEEDVEPQVPPDLESSVVAACAASTWRQLRTISIRSASGTTGVTPLWAIRTSSDTTPAIRYSQRSLALRSRLRCPM